MNESEANYGSTVSIESLKVIAESVGVTNFNDESAKEISDDLTYRVMLILQDAMKFMYHGKRIKLLPVDIDNSLKIKNMEVLYGFTSEEDIPFRFASGGGRELHFMDDKEIELAEYNRITARVPLGVSIRSHWLAIDGVPIARQENFPVSLTKDNQKYESMHIANKLRKQMESERENSGRPSSRGYKMRSVETVQVKQLQPHELSVEQQQYYKEITEACVGSDENRRTEALQSLALDPGMIDLLPHLSLFITEGIRINIVQTNLALLIYLNRMARALFDNPSLYMDKYLHVFVPNIVSCVISKELCSRPEQENHWALRDFASRIMALICKDYNIRASEIHKRILRTYCIALSENAPLTTIYGGIQGIAELGPQYISMYVLPRIRSLSSRIEHADVMTFNSLDRNSAKNLRILLTKVLTPILKSMETDATLNDFKEKYGYLGPVLFTSVNKARISTTMTNVLSTKKGRKSPYSSSQ